MVELKWLPIENEIAICALPVDHTALNFRTAMVCFRRPSREKHHIKIS